MSDVDYVRVHEAMRRVGVQLEGERLDRIAKRNAAHVAAGGVICSQCTRPGRRFMNIRACELHAPAAIAPTTCNKPLVCYAACCVARLPKIEYKLDADELVHAWRGRARSEIMQLTRLGSFGLGDLAAILPTHVPRARARELVTSLLDDGVNAGVLVRIDGRWRARREGEELQHVDTYVPPPPVDTDRVERDNRYQ